MSELSEKNPFEDSPFSFRQYKNGGVSVYYNDREVTISRKWVKKLEANSTEAGVDEVRKIFEAKKESLKAKKEAIKPAPQRINSDWQTLWNETKNRHNEMLDATGTKFRIADYSDS